MKNLQIMLLALCLVASSAYAAVITQTKDIPVHTPGSTYESVFDQFDTAKGNLDSIQIIFNLYIYGGSMSVDNDSDLPQTVKTIITVESGLRSANVFLYNTTSDSETGGFVRPWALVENSISHEFSLDKTSGDDITKYNETAYDDWASVSGPIADNAVEKSVSDYVNPSAFGGYQGTGTYTISAVTKQVSSSEGTGQLAVTMMQTYGNVTVNYTYTPVPEPATASLAGVGLLMLIRRRRKA